MGGNLDISTMTGGLCRVCGADLHHLFVDLGMSPLCERFVEASRVNAMEAFFPLRVYVCERCLLVQQAARTCHQLAPSHDSFPSARNSRPMTSTMRSQSSCSRSSCFRPSRVSE